VRRQNCGVLPIELWRLINEIGIWAAPKGPYSLVYVEPGDDKLKEKIRTKGIPHPSGPFYYQESILAEYVSENFEKLAEIQAWLENPQAYTIPKNFISKRFYLYESEFESMLTTRINFELIRHMMAKQGTLCC